VVSAEARRNRVLKEIAKYRKNLADDARESAERAIDEEAAGGVAGPSSGWLAGGFWPGRRAEQ
jgi:hypothetical protein